MWGAQEEGASEAALGTPWRVLAREALSWGGMYSAGWAGVGKEGEDSFGAGVPGTLEHVFRGVLERALSMLFDEWRCVAEAKRQMASVSLCSVIRLAMVSSSEELVSVTLFKPSLRSTRRGFRCLGKAPSTGTSE